MEEKVMGSGEGGVGEVGEVVVGDEVDAGGLVGEGVVDVVWGEEVEVGVEGGGGGEEVVGGD
ncbi:hypothetical protein, partial [Prescottella equi]|uniref:hypothetical protein n=1 Tax=Rhodococcus hoagii TaxID=43767 RepID=UPI001C92FB7F